MAGTAEISNFKKSNIKLKFWKAILWLVVLIGLTYFTAYQLIGDTDIGGYDSQLEGTTFHESPGLLGSIKYVLGFSNTGLREKRQDSDSDDPSNWDPAEWNPYEDPLSYDEFWQNILDDYDEYPPNVNESTVNQQDSTLPYPSTSTAIEEYSTSTASTSSLPSETTSRPQLVQTSTSEQSEFVPSQADSITSTANAEFNDDPCQPNSYKLNQVCQLTDTQLTTFGELLTLEDIAALIFDPDIINKLRTDCTNGTWCIGTSNDRTMFRDVDEGFLELCPVTSCLLDIPDICINQERRITISTFILLCESSRMNTSTTSCLRSIIKMAHVTMANVLRNSVDQNETCRVNDQCHGSCQSLAQQLHCMSTTCQHRYDLFTEYGPWQWFFSMENSTTRCNLNYSDCSIFSDLSQPFYQQWWSKLRTLDTTVFSCLVAACVITVSGFIIAILAVCIKKSAGYHRDEVTYKEVKNEDEYDEIDEFSAA